ncbi:MAG: Fe-S cluster assembly ATPase SufC [Candidatus Komeilibacteria bacterium]
MALEIKNLELALRQAQGENKDIIHDLSLTIKPGEAQVLMGPNGSGKSSLAQALIGSKKLEVRSKGVFLDGKNISQLKTDERARAGLFLAWQYPREIEGVEVATFLKAAVESQRKNKMGETYKPLTMSEFLEIVEELMVKLQMDKKILQRDLNYGFSGGEKKKLEILQMLLLEPKYAILDEIDSGLDIDALKTICAAINSFRSRDRGLLLITHYNRLLKLVQPDVVHIMINGKIVKSSGKELADMIEKSGYGNL